MPEVHPEALRDLRTKKGLSQKSLADESKVGRATIQRIEDAKGPRDVRTLTVERIAKALGVEAADLARSPQDDETGHHLVPMRRVGALIDGRKALGFELVHAIYGISPREQITMAPLMTALMVEACLDWRRKQLDRIAALADELRSLSGSHFAYQVASDKADDRVEHERKAIRDLDVFGWNLREDDYDDGYDPERNTTFADFLRDFARNLDIRTLAFDDEEDVSLDGLPAYAFVPHYIDGITGGDPDARYALERGHVQFGDIPQSLMPDDRRDDRVAWIVSKIPDKERAARREWLAELGIDIPSSPEPTPETAPEQEPAP